MTVVVPSVEMSGINVREEVVKRSVGVVEGIKGVGGV